ncbi:hypothetical protein B4143_1938 [Bacillus subtilis]|nr:FAD-dependent oxidase [Bacillus subtilis]KIO56645.1 hypothetical protein B4143_1938 [Bacillus subtilis]
MGDYVNWPDIKIRNWPRTYYGENVERLRRVKTKYDPENVFRFEQSIPPLRRSLFFKKMKMEHSPSSSFLLI